MGEGIWLAAGAATRELTLFAAVGLLLGGLDDLAVDLLWLWRWARRRWRGWGGATLATLPPPAVPGRIAVFVPAWDEAAVIGAMLRTALARFDHGDYRLYVGTYPNDPGTRGAVAEVAAEDGRVRPVLTANDGPTTKADALNACWHALLADEAAEGVAVKAVALHDAEDIVHSGELAVFDRLIGPLDLVQLPVLPLPDPGSRWIAGTYLDEFAEAHGKQLVVRETIGAAVPSAGTGTAVSRRLLGHVAAARGGAPFDPDSLTEDYELGLAVKALGGRGAFVRLPAAPGHPPVAVRAHFPATLEASIRQKARWINGIALSGWDRTGWAGGIAERWMRLRDRRAPLAAAVLAAGYAAFLGWLVLGRAGRAPAMLPPGTELLVVANFALLVWRVALRMAFVAASYGAVEALRSVPRIPVSNAIAVAAALRALGGYATMRRTGRVVWDKTCHVFPDTAPAE